MSVHWTFPRSLGDRSTELWVSGLPGEVTRDDVTLQILALSPFAVARAPPPARKPQMPTRWTSRQRMSSIAIGCDQYLMHAPFSFQALQAFIAAQNTLLARTREDLERLKHLRDGADEFTAEEVLHEVRTLVPRMVIC
jgi:hypothetical protein